MKERVPLHIKNMGCGESRYFKRNIEGSEFKKWVGKRITIKNYIPPEYIYYPSDIADFAPHTKLDGKFEIEVEGVNKKYLVEIEYNHNIEKRTGNSIVYSENKRIPLKVLMGNNSFILQEGSCLEKTQMIKTCLFGTTENIVWNYYLYLPKEMGMGKYYHIKEPIYSIE